MSAPVKLVFDARIVTPGREPITVRVNGRVGWAILSLMRAGSKGCTPMDRPAPRWSDYVFKAKHLGFNIETRHESHGGPFAGHHGNYVLHDTVLASGGTLRDYLASAEGQREFPGMAARVAA